MCTKPIDNLHEEGLIARERPENGARIVVNADAVVRHEVEVQEALFSERLE